MNASATERQTKTARIIELRAIAGLSWSQIAAQVGGSPGSASNLFKKGRARLIEAASVFLRAAEKERVAQFRDEAFQKWPSCRVWPITAWIEPKMGEDSLEPFFRAVSCVPASFQPEDRQKLLDSLAPLMKAPSSESTQPRTPEPVKIAPVAPEPEHRYVRKPGFIETLKRNLEAGEEPQAAPLAPELEPEQRPLNRQPEPNPAPVKPAQVPASLAFRADGKIWLGGEF